MATKQKFEARERDLVWEFFNRRTTGFYVDVGANDLNEFSLTWFLEQKGWRGILIEPRPLCCTHLRQGRKNSLVIHAACSSPDKTGGAMFHYCKRRDFSSLEQNPDDPHAEYERSELVKVMTLDEILAANGNPTVDFLCIDTAGTELDVLKGLNLAQHRPSLVSMNDSMYGWRKHFHLKRMNYKLVKRMTTNNWYVPEDYPFPLSSFSERLQLFRKAYLGTPWRMLKQRGKKKRKATPIVW